MKRKGLAQDAAGYDVGSDAATPRHLRLWRESRGYTLQKLEKESGIGFSALSRMERGERKTTTDDLERLSRVYGVSVTELMRAPDPSAGGEKRSVNLTVNGELLKAAKAEGLNLSQTLERALSESLKQIARDRWLAENHDAIEYYNSHIEKHGVFSQGRRRF